MCVPIYKRGGFVNQVNDRLMMRINFRIRVVSFECTAARRFNYKASLPYVELISIFLIESRSYYTHTVREKKKRNNDPRRQNLPKSY